ncbi:MAG: helix-turn-helix domain-containing protein [Hyphomicrobium sp.]
METFTEDRVLRIELRQADGGEKGPAQAPGGQSAGTLSHRTATATAEQVMRLISGRNVELLQMIKNRQPQSLAELSRLSGRPTASLTRTLQRLAALGIVVMRKSKGREKIPVVACDCLRLDLPLTAPVAEKV